MESSSVLLWFLALAVLILMSGVMLAAWAFGLAVKNGGWTDVFWTWGTSLTLAGAALLATTPDGSQTRRILVAALMLAWGLRLGLYLTPRVARHPEDARYAAGHARRGADRVQQRGAKQLRPLHLGHLHTLARVD